MKKKIVVILVVIVVIAGMVVGVVTWGREWPYRIYPTHIKEMSIERNRLYPSNLSVRIVVPGNIGCSRPWLYGSMRFRNKVFVWVLTIRNVRAACICLEVYEEKIIPIGRRFIEGVNYTVNVNGVIETFSVEGLIR